MNQIGEIIDFAKGAKEIARSAAEARAEYPSAFAIGALLSMALRELCQYALRKGPPQGLRDDLSALFGTTLTDEHTQKIREFVLQREIAREA